jgi:23S rRNA pseudouridine1911/1915/1917 synthase
MTTILPRQVRRLELPIGPELANLRVDILLKKYLHLSGTVIRRVKWLPDGILVDGQRVNTRFVPRPGQVLSVRLSDPERHSGILPSPGPLDIIYEDEDLLVLNKAPGVPVHPGPGHFDDTIGNFLLDYYDKTGVEADFHPVHRLDRGTSGLLVVAKHPHAQEVLKNQLHTAAFQRVYLAVCEGAPQPPSGVIDAPLGPKPGSLVEQTICPDGKPARTQYETLRQSDRRALVRLVLDTGRTHQIRVHMASLGHPLTGDFLYGTEAPDLIRRPALHSAQLSFLHPITGIKLNFFLPLPADMSALLDRQQIF